MARYDYTAQLEGAERFVDRPDGTRLRTVSVGNGGRTVVLAHGYGATADEWNLVAPLLAEQGVRVVAFDQRGHGRSSIGSNGIGSMQMASDYGAILDAYDVVDGVLVGHSMGGFLALAFLLDDQSTATQRVSSLFLMATFAGNVNRKNPQNRLQIPLIQSGILLRLLGIGAIARAFTKSLVGDGFEPEISNAFTTQFRVSDHSKLVPILRALVEEDRYDRLGELRLPCTIIVGTKDKTTPPFHTADLHAGIVDSKLVSIAGKGHLLNWEAPKEVAQEIGLLAAT
ncbi:MAG: alpha/beta hydrolase [Acidimicrobiia bacterium]|nr:alpha/beta hydrolase [Acidimicrobiia bacterium]